MRSFAILTSSIVLLISLTSCSNVNGGSAASSADTVKYEYKAARFIQQNEKVKDSSLLFRSVIAYPLFDAKSNKTLADSINTFIGKSTFGGFSTAEEATKAFVDECIAQTKGEEGMSMQGWESMDSITVIFNTPSVVSLRKMHYSFTGGAHGNASESYACFRANNGKHLLFSDVVVSSDKLSELKKVNLAMLKQARNISKESNLEESGLFITKDELPLPSSFTFTKDGMLMAYDYYEIASHADGVIKYTIPYDMLKGIVKEDLLPVKK